MNKSPWRLIVDPPQSAALNMAVDEAIAIAFSEGKAPETLRLYRWNQASFSIGAFQQLEVDWIASLEARQINIVRRMTGGREILHDDELTYSLISSTTHPLFSGGIKSTFQSIAQGLLAGLRQMNVEATLHAPERRLRAERKNTLCFDAVSGYEITIQGKKLIGSAQRRWKNHFLQHGSLIIGQNKPAKNQAEDFLSELVSENQITLAELLHPLPDHEILIKAIKAGFENALFLNLQPGKLSDYEKMLTESLQKKYTSRAWTLHRNKTEKSQLSG